MVIFCTVVLTALVLGFIIFFLYPRSVTMTVVSGSAANLTVSCSGFDDLYLEHFNMSIYWTLNVQNNNYMAVTVKKGNLVMKGLGVSALVVLAGAGCTRTEPSWQVDVSSPCVWAHPCSFPLVHGHGQHVSGV